MAIKKNKVNRKNTEEKQTTNNQTTEEDVWEKAWKEAVHFDEDTKDKQPKTKSEFFVWNKKYLTICIYAVISVLACTLLIKGIVGWESTKAEIGRFVGVVSPFLWGAFIAFLINPFVRVLDNNVFGRIKFIKNREKIRKILSILIAYVLVLMLVVVAFFYLIPQIGQSITELVAQVPKWIDQVSEWIYEFEANNDQFNFEKINEYINEFEPMILDFSKNIVTNVVPLLYSTSLSVVKIVTNLLIAVMVSVYMINDKKILLGGFKKILYAVTKDKTGSFVMQTLRECYRIFSQFVFGKAIDSAIIGVLCLVVMSIMRLPFAALISLIVGVTNMIPYFGPFIGAVPGTLFIFMVNPLQALFFVIMIIVLQQFDGLFLGPRILGETVGLRPLWIIFAIIIGGSVGGVVGMFLGVPIIAVFSYLFDMFINKLLVKKNIKIDN